jgi:hypothetical protein
MAPMTLLARTSLACALIGLSACSYFQSSSPKPPQTAAAPGTVFTAELSGRDEVPPTNSRAARGTARLEYDKATHLVIWTVSFSNPTSTATGAHIHGPADLGSNAGIVLDLAHNMFPVVGPLKGSATLSDAQAADLMAGKWYVNIHTQNNPNGEIRGQLVAK